MRGELGGAGAVVDVDQHDAVDDGPLHGDQRHAAGAQQVQRRVVVEPAGREDRRVEGDPGDLVGARSAGLAGEQEQADAVPAEHLGDPVHHLHGDGVAEGVEQALADEGADDAAAAAAQRRRDRVGARRSRARPPRRAPGRGWRGRPAGCRRRRARPSTARRRRGTPRRRASAGRSPALGGRPASRRSGTRWGATQSTVTGLSGARSGVPSSNRIDSIGDDVVPVLQARPESYMRGRPSPPPSSSTACVFASGHRAGPGAARHAGPVPGPARPPAALRLDRRHRRPAALRADRAALRRERRQCSAARFSVALGLAGLGVGLLAASVALVVPEPGAGRAGHGRLGRRDERPGRGRRAPPGPRPHAPAARHVQHRHRSSAPASVRSRPRSASRSPCRCWSWPSSRRCRWRGPCAASCRRRRPSPAGERPRRAGRPDRLARAAHARRRPDGAGLRLHRGLGQRLDGRS